MNRRNRDIAKERRREFTCYLVAAVLIIVFMVVI